MMLDADNRAMSRRLRKPLWAIAALLLVNAVLLLAQPAMALTRGIEDFFFGPKLVRAEVILQDAGGVYDYRIDRGRIRNVTNDSVTLLERDGTLVTISVSPSADILFRGRRVTLTQLRRNMIATTIRLGDAAAHQVQVQPRK
jgi:hypothetical protein